MSKDQPAPVTASAVTAAIVGGTLGPAVFLMLPAIASLLEHDYGLTEAQIGFFSFADLGGLTLGSALGAHLIARSSLRRLARVGIAIAIAANALTALTHAYVPLLVIRVICGVGGGVLIALCYAVVGNSRHVDRNFGIYVVCQSAFGALAIRAMPELTTRIGASAVFALITGLLVISFPMFGCLPSQHANLSSGAAGRKRIERAAWVGLCGIFVFFIAQGAVWTYIELMGVRGGVDSQAAATGVAFATLIGLSGPLAATVLGAKIGRTTPLLAALAIVLAASVLLSLPLSPVRFASAACLFTIAWNLSIPYQLSSIASVDKTGQVVGWASSVSLAGLAVGPLLGAMILGGTGFSGVLWLSAALCILSFFGMVPSLIGQTSQ